jgi:hypothetical protein
MLNIFKPLAILATVSLIAACSTTVEVDNVEPIETETTEVEQETVEEVEEAPEPVELTYEVNTPEVIDTILSSLTESLNKQKSSGFLELRDGISADSKYQILLIEATSAPNLIYYYDTQRGFSRVTELNKNEIQYMHLMDTINFIVNTFSNNVGSRDELVKEFTFKKESPTNIYIMEESNLFGMKTVYRIEITEGLISKINLKNSEIEETVTYQYGLSSSAQKYINESFKPNQPQPVE